MHSSIRPDLLLLEAVLPFEVLPVRNREQVPGRVAEHCATRENKFIRAAAFLCGNI